MANESLPKKPKSALVAVRLPIDLYEILKRRAESNRPFTLSAYIRYRLGYDLKRKHRRRLRI